jgi:hypothetical protein
VGDGRGVGGDIRSTCEHCKDVPVHVDEGPALAERKLVDGKSVDADQHPHSIPLDPHEANADEL